MLGTLSPVVGPVLSRGALLGEHWGYEERQRICEKTSPPTVFLIVVNSPCRPVYHADLRCPAHAFVPWPGSVKRPSFPSGTLNAPARGPLLCQERPTQSALTWEPPCIPGEPWFVLAYEYWGCRV